MVEAEIKIVEEAILALDKYYTLYNRAKNAVSLVEASTLMRTLLPVDHPYRNSPKSLAYERLLNLSNKPYVYEPCTDAPW